MGQFTWLEIGEGVAFLVVLAMLLISLHGREAEKWSRMEGWSVVFAGRIDDSLKSFVSRLEAALIPPKKPEPPTVAKEPTLLDTYQTRDAFNAAIASYPKAVQLDTEIVHGGAMPLEVFATQGESVVRRA